MEKPVAPVLETIREEIVQNSVKCLLHNLIFSYNKISKLSRQRKQFFFLKKSTSPTSLEARMKTDNWGLGPGLV